MQRRVRSPGFTLIELATALVVVGILVGIAAVPFARLLDRYAVRAAREALAAGIAHARPAAAAGGGAELVIDLHGARYSIHTAGGGAGAPYAAPVDLRAQYGVTLTSDGQPMDTVVLRFDALGVGRMTSRTFRVRRGSAEAGLTVATYGRVRRW